MSRDMYELIFRVIQIKSFFCDVWFYFFFIRTPVGLQGATVYSHHDLITLIECFGKLDISSSIRDQSFACLFHMRNVRMTNIFALQDRLGSFNITILKRTGEAPDINDPSAGAFGITDPSTQDAADAMKGVLLSGFPKSSSSKKVALFFAYCYTVAIVGVIFILCHNALPCHFRCPSKTVFSFFTLFSSNTSSSLSST